MLLMIRYLDSRYVEEQTWMLRETNIFFNGSNSANRMIEGLGSVAKLDPAVCLEMSVKTM